jgi:hypothetical protein
MNVQNVIDRVRRTFGDEAAVQVADSDIINWINDGQIEIVKNNDAALQKTSTVNLVAGQASYTPPTDYLLIRTVRYKYTDMLAYSALKYKSIQELDESIDGWDGSAYVTGSPQYYTINDGTIVLFPVPDQSATAGLKILYNQKPTDVTTNADALAVPAIYHPTIVTYCLWQASLLDEDRDSAVLYQSNFKTDIDHLIGRENRDPTSTYPTITVLDYDQ